MPGVYKLKTCPQCNDLHRQRGKYCSQSCANAYNYQNRNGSNPEFMREIMNDYNKWLKTLSPLQQLELRERKESKKLIANLKDIIKDCNEIIESLKDDIKPQKQFIQDNPTDPHLIKLIYAACPPDHHVDHIIPRARGGIDHQDNFQYLHKTDNLRKQDRLESELNFTLRKIDWKEAIEHDEVNKCYTIKEEWIKEKILSHPLVTLKDKIERVDNIVDELIEQTSPNHNKKLTLEQINLIIELTKEGTTVMEIAEKLKISPKTIIKYRFKLGIDTARGRFFKLVDPNGTIHEGRNLEAFAKKHNLNINGLHGLLSGKRKRGYYRGWSLPKVLITNFMEH
jgi:5-methylcytosine-specific restriction endonuclease McrA